MTGGGNGDGIEVEAATVHGFVQPGWETVREVFRASFDEGREGGSGAQLAVYHRGRLVVDLWGGGGDSMMENGGAAVIPIFSCTKVAESLVMAMLADRSLLSFNAPIAEYWPEFAQNGKGGITVADLMRHQAGLAAPDEPIPLDAVKNPPLLGALLERQAPWVVEEGGGKRQLYHAVTRGLYASEIVRRVDPKGRTLAGFFREEIADPLRLSFYIGITEEERERQPVMDIAAPPVSLFVKHALQYLLPSESARRAVVVGDEEGGDDEHDVIKDYEFQHVLGFVRRAFGFDFELNSVLLRSLTKALAGLSTVTDANSPAVQAAEIPSAGGLANARAMAQIASMLAETGEHAPFFNRKGGRERAMATVGPALRDEGLGFNVSYTAAGWGVGRFAEWGFPQFTGWAGVSGSVLQWSEADEIGFAFVPTVAYGRIHKPRGLRLMRAVQAVVDETNKKDK